MRDSRNSILLCFVLLHSGSAFSISISKQLSIRTVNELPNTCGPNKLLLARQPVFSQLMATANMDDNFDGIDLAKLLGKNQLKRMRRRNAAKQVSMKHPVKIIIAGAPASGKGTQCEVIKNKYGVVHLSTGDMLRAAVTAGTPIGQQAKEYMDSGKLVPDEVIIGVVKERLSHNDCKTNGWLLDGFPRTVAQAQALQDADIVADCFLFLDVPDDVLVHRVVDRRTDPTTGKIYHLTFSPPPPDDDLTARLVHRSDDTEEKIKVRLEQFHAHVNAIKDSFQSISVYINGNQPPDQVSKSILSAIDTSLSRKVSA